MDLALSAVPSLKSDLAVDGSLYWAFCLFCAQCYTFKKFENYAACDDRFANMKQKKVDHSKRLSAFSFIEKYRSYFKERKVKINILIYCKTRIWNRERKQYILGISLKPVGEKRKHSLAELWASCLTQFLSLSLFFFFTPHTIAVREWKTSKQTWGRVCLQILLHGLFWPT